MEMEPSESNWDRNPLKMEHILPQIFSFADVSTLKVARQVCSLWEREATPELLKKAHIAVPPHFHSPPESECELSLTPFSNPTPTVSVDLEKNENLVLELSHLENLLSLSFARWPISWHIENCDYTHLLNNKLPSVFSSDDPLIRRVVTTLKYGCGDSWNSFPSFSSFSGPGFSFNSFLSSKNLCCEFSLKMNTEHLNSILSQLPHLQRLETCCLDFSPEQSWLQDKDEAASENGNGNPNQNQILNRSQNQNRTAVIKVNKKLTTLLEKLESLEEIQLNFWLSAPLLRSYMEYAGQLKAISSLKVNNEQVLKLYTNSSIQWNIQRVEVMLDSETSPEVLREFLRKISGTLKHFSLSFYRRQRQRRGRRLGFGLLGNPGQNAGQNPNPNADLNVTRRRRRQIHDFSHPSHLPWTLKKLETLDITLIDNNSCSNNSISGENDCDDESGQTQGQLEFSMWKIVAVALQLPTLKNLTIRGRITIHFDEMLSQFSRQRRSRKLSCESLERVVICPSVFSSSSILFSNLWPNLKSMVIFLDLGEISTSTALFAIFSGLPKLQKLELFFRSRSSEKDPAGKVVGKFGVDELITGVNLSGVRDSEFKSITNMQSLTFLKVEVSESIPESKSLTDISLYNGFAHLKKIQTLEICSRFVSEKAVADLKAELGPFVNVHLYKPQAESQIH